MRLKGEIETNEKGLEREGDKGEGAIPRKRERRRKTKEERERESFNEREKGGDLIQ